MHPKNEFAYLLYYTVQPARGQNAHGVSGAQTQT